ncbi:GNAT family N-acetyltransferase [Actinomadura sp. 9N407]|uniref:GNAT family N-acetyltransferase n=1 Tax=Actinomadura sp. 9N407 TaxID=3375154 RepID=UPI00378F0E9E
MNVVTLADRPGLDLDIAPWPEFIYHDPVNAELTPFLATDFPDYQLALLDEDRVIAAAASVPFHWPGGDLPAEGWDFALRRAFDDRTAGRDPNVASALWIVVAPDHLGTGLSRVMVEALRETAARYGLTALYAPVRPTLKARYPLIPMEEYITWTRPDDAPFDPWLRVHLKLGGKILGVCPRSMTITGSPAEWHQWTGVEMPAPGSYVVPDALCPVEVAHDEGHYEEPNVWIHHTVN